MLLLLGLGYIMLEALRFGLGIVRSDAICCWCYWTVSAPRSRPEEQTLLVLSLSLVVIAIISEDAQDKSPVYNANG